MITVHIRKQGGAAIMTIPADVLKMMDVNVGETLVLDVTQQHFVASPVRKLARKRYSLEELLQGVSSKVAKALKDETEWARAGNPMGREEI